MKKLLEVKNLKTHFFTMGETVKSVDGVSFDVYEGETFGLVGESGCGKSQTCRSILRLIKKPGRIVEGQILYKGKDLVSMNDRQMRQIRGREIAAIFQEPMTSLNPVLKIKKQILEVFDDADMTAQQKYDQALELMKLVGIPAPEQRLEDYPHQFSGGMRQRAMIAIALGAKPKLLIADEPTTALDVTIQDQIMSLINELKSKLDMSVILVTHDMGIIAQMCDRVAIMYAGHIVEMADTVTLFAKPRHPYTYALMGSIPDPDRAGAVLKTIEGTPPDLGNLPPGCPFAKRCPYKIDRCLEENPVLSEYEENHLVSCHCIDKTNHFEGIIPVSRINGQEGRAE